MRLNEALANKKMDVRLRDKMLSENKLESEEVQNYLDSLPDDSENCEIINPFEGRGAKYFVKLQDGGSSKNSKNAH